MKKLLYTIAAVIMTLVSVLAIPNCYDVYKYNELFKGFVVITAVFLIITILLWRKVYLLNKHK